MRISDWSSDVCSSDLTELVIIVTPRLVKPAAPESLTVPTDRAAAPNELDLFLLGRTDRAVGVNPINPTQPPVDRPKAVATSAPTGVDGDYGHILRCRSCAARQQPSRSGPVPP